VKKLSDKRPLTIYTRLPVEIIKHPMMLYTGEMINEQK